jgi:hypothetical protein
MAKQAINIGTIANDGTGDPLRTAFDKINDNFDENYLALDGKKFYHGFVNTTDSSLPEDIATAAGELIFTLTKVNNFTVFIGGVAIEKTASLSIDFMVQAAWGNGTTDPVGQWYVWMTSAGVLAASKSEWDILNTTVTPVSIVWVQSTGGGNFEGIVSEERHDYRRNLLEHHSQHDSWGCQYVSGLNGITVGSGVVDNSTNTFSLNGGVIRDEELFHTLSNPQTNARIGYKDGANNWIKFDASGTGYAKLSGTAPYYDASGTLTTIPTTSGGRYGIYWVFATNRKVVPVVIIMGQNFYNSVSSAQAAAQPSLYGFSTAEWKLCYRVIIRNVSGVINWIRTDPLYNISTGPPVSAAALQTITAGNTTLSPFGGITETNVQDGMEGLETRKMANLVEDLTPQLGGELDAGAHSIGFTQQSTTGDGTTTIDWKLGNDFYFTFGSTNDVFTFTAPSKPCHLTLVLKQYSTGGKTATWPNTVMWPSGTAPTLSVGNNAIDIVSFYWDGTNYYGVGSLNFSIPA